MGADGVGLRGGLGHGGGGGGREGWRRDGFKINGRAVEVEDLDCGRNGWVGMMDRV